MEAAGSIIGLLAIGYDIYKSLDEFVSSCKDAPTIAKDTRDQVYDFRYSLQKLAPYIRETAEITSLGRSSTYINHLKITLASSVDTFSQTQRLLDRLSPRRQEKMDYLGRIRWARAEGNLNKLLIRIQKHKTALILLLTIWTSESSAQTENCVDRLNDLLTSIMAPGGALGASPLPFNPSTDALSLNDDGGHMYSSTQEIQRRFASADGVSVSNLSTTRSLGGRSRRNLESILMKSRAYSNPDRIGDSRFSVSSSQRHTRWSVFSGGSNTSVFSLCYTGFENLGRTLAEERDLSQIPLPLHMGSLHNKSWYPPSGSSVKSDHILTPQPLKRPTSFRSRPTKRMGSMDDRGGQNAHPGVSEGLAFMVDELYRSSGSCEDFAVFCRKHTQDACLEGDLRKMEILFAWEAEMMRVHPEWKHRHSAINYIWKTAEGESVLGLAIKECDSEMVEMILDRGADVNHCIVDRPMALEVAIGTKNVAMVQILLNRGADVNRCSQSSCTELLFMAVGAENSLMLGMILDRGADVNYSTVDRPMALEVAIETNNAAIVQLLLDRGADINLCSQSMSTELLVTAVERGDMLMLEVILDQGINVNHSIVDRPMALEMAIETNNAAIVQLLLDRGADVNLCSQPSSTELLLMAIRSGNGLMLGMILDRGVNVNHPSMHGSTALQVAIETKNVAMVQVLFNRGADVNLSSQSTCTELLFMAVGAGDTLMLEAILDRGINVNHPSMHGSTALEVAIGTNNLAMAQILLNRGADVKRCSQSTCTELLLMAIRSVNSLMLGMILDRGINVNHSSVHGSMALQVAIETNNAAMVQILLDRGANINLCSEFMFSLLVRVAVRAKNEAMIKKILHRGAKFHRGLVGSSADAGESLAFMVDELSRSSGSRDDFTVCSRRHIEDACLEGDLRKMKILFAWEAEMLRVHPQWKAKGSVISDTWETAKGDSILGLAIKECDSKMVEMILNRGADVNHYIVDRPMALEVAIGTKNVAMVQILLNRGADVNHPIVDRPMALEMAIETSNAAIVQLLLDRGADINLCSQSMSTELLVTAVERGDMLMLEVILDQGINVNHPSMHGSTALQIAIKTKNVAIVQMLLDRGADINQCSQSTPISLLLMAFRANNSAIVKMLLDRGVVDVNERLIGESTLLHVAIEANSSAIVKVLLDKGADTNRYSASKPIMPLVMAIKAENEEIVEMILDRGADINHRFLYGPTALQVAIEANHVAIVQLLVDRRADINRCSNTALSMLANMIELPEHVVCI